MALVNRKNLQTSSKSDYRGRQLLFVAVASALSAHSVLAANDTWAGTTDSLWATSSNWSTNSGAPGAGQTATFSLSSAAVNNRTIVDIGSTATIGAIRFDSADAAAYTIGTTAGVGSITLDTPGTAVSMSSNVVNNQLINANLMLTAVGSTSFTSLINDSLTNTLTIAGGIRSSTLGIKVLNVGGAGNTTISGAFSTSVGSLNLLKTGAGTLTLSGGGVFDGSAAVGNVPANSLYPVVLREGTTRLAGGSFSVNGEMVLGGVVANGGPGTNNRLQVDAGTLAVTSWFSVGRGNGTGGVSTDVVVNNTGVITAANISAGFNGGDATNLPKGSITLNDSGRLTSGGILNLGESAGSNYNLTMNGSSSLSVAGELRVAGTSGVATFTMNGTSTASVGSFFLGRGDNASQTATGTAILNSGTSFRSEGDVCLGFAGNANVGNLIINGATMNIASNTERWMIIDQWDTSRGQVDMNSGTLNLNANTDMRFFTGGTGTSGAGTVNQNGGQITFYSDNATTISGTGGVIDMARAGSATAVSTYNLNGGTLTVGQVLSTGTLSTRIFNFNGGVIRPTGASTSWINLGAGNTALNVLAGGAKIDTRGLAVTIAQPLIGSSGDGGLTKSGAGTLTLSGGNSTYNGPTVINQGQLSISNNLANTSGVTIASGAIFNPRGNVTVANGVSSTGGIVDLTDGAAGTLSTNSLSLSNGSISLEFAGGATDRINLTGAASLTGTKINLGLASGVVNPGSYTLITGTGGLNSGLSLGTLPPGFFDFSLASSTATSTILSVTGNPTPAVAYWTGKGSSGTADATNKWGAGASIGTSNWSTTANGLTDPKQVPGPSTDVTFTASNAVGVSGALNTTLEAAYSVNSLSIDVPASTSITSVGITTTGQSLTIGAGGLTQAATSNAGATVSGTGTVILAASQTWANNSASAMSVNSTVRALSGTTTLTVGGTGAGTTNIGGAITDGSGNVALLFNNPNNTTNLAGANVYAGPTNINAGKVNLTGSITTPGAFNVGGEGGVGTLSVSGGNLNVSNQVNVGYRTGVGTLNITGGTFTTNNDFRVGGSDVNGATYNGSGNVSMSAGVASFSSMTVARGNSADNAMSGTVSLSGGVMNSANDVILGYAGSGLGKMVISGGSFNVATTATKWMMLGFWDSTKGQVDISNGSLNLNYGSSLVLGRQSTNGYAVVNQTGGAVTGFSDYATTVGGAGGLDMQYVGSTAFTSTYNLDGGTLSIFRIFSSTATGSRVFNFNGGTLRPVQSDTAFMNLGTGSATANVRNGGAKIDTNGFNVTIASPLVHSNIGGDAAIDGGLTKSGAGVLTMTGSSTYTGPTNLNAGGLILSKGSSGGGAITAAAGTQLGITSSSATGSLNTSALTLNGGSLLFSLGAVTPTDPLINVTGNLVRSGTNVVNVTGSLSAGSITLINYSGNESGGGSFTLGTMPSRTLGQLFDLGNGKVYINVSVSPIKWTGLGNGTWASVTQSPKNWVDGSTPLDYTSGDPVVLDDTATGTLSVSIPADVTPGGITVNNSTKDYKFLGIGGKITGSTALIKSGTGKLTIDVPIGAPGNDYSGGTTINGGTVEITGASDTTANLNVLGTGPIVNNGVLAFNRPSGGANLHYDYTLLRPVVSGSGSLIIGSNVATDGAHTFDGAVIVKSGFLYFLDNPQAMGSAVGGTTVENGAGLQVFNASRDYGLENITMSGDGPTYNGGVSYEGAIYVAGGITGTMRGTMTLTGDTSFRADGTLLFSGSVAGATNTISKNGNGRLVIAGNATYGASNVNAGGYLQIGNGGTLGNLGSGDVVLSNGTLDFNRTDTYTVNNNINNNGAVSNSGTGTTILASMGSSFIGSVVANSGTLVLAGLGYPSTMTVNGDGVLKVANDNYGLFVPAVFVNSNNAQLGALELSGGVTSPFTGGSITFAGRNNTSTGIRSTGGSNTLNSPITLAAGGGQYRIEAAAGGTLSVTGTVTGNTGLAAGERVLTFAGAGVGTMTGVISTGGASTLSIQKVGSGTWTMDAAHSYNGNTTVNGGTLVVKLAAQAPITTGVGSDIKNGYLVMEHGSDGGAFAAGVKTKLTSGFNDQSPKFSNGTYRSSTADGSKGLGWKDDGTNTTIGYAYYGDANLDGTVDSTDFSALAGNYGKSLQDWVNGDFDYNGKVNTLDFNQLAGNFGLTIVAPVASPTLAPVASLGAVVPEPSTLGLLGVAAGMMIRRRRR